MKERNVGGMWEEEREMRVWELYIVEGGVDRSEWDISDIEGWWG